MDAQEHRNLQEAYLDVYEQEEVLDESIDIFNYMIEYLMTEGYADNEEAALAIMGNMSEDWKCSILESKIDEDISPKKKSQVKKKRPNADTNNPKYANPQTDTNSLSGSGGSRVRTSDKDWDE